MMRSVPLFEIPQPNMLYTTVALQPILYLLFNSRFKPCSLYRSMWGTYVTDVDKKYVYNTGT